MRWSREAGAGKTWREDADGETAGAPPRVAEAAPAESRQSRDMKRRSTYQNISATEANSESAALT
jgi:hypothetical protein